MPGGPLKRRTLLTAVLALALPMTLAAEPRTPVAIAAAADLQGALELVKAAFEARHPGIQLQLTFGASGSLCAQLFQGAPFDVFLSADTGFPEQLAKDGLATPAGPFPYATGSLALWVRKDLGLDGREGLKTLLHPGLRKIAVANPQVAPYGRAAEAALRGAGIYDTVKPRLVFAGNIAQAAQFLQTGTAEAGLISQAQANHPLLRQTGWTWTVPAGTYPPLRQAGILLRRSAVHPQAQLFRAFLLGAEGQALLAAHGFGRP